MKNIFLVGMPSSGKSTLGKGLAALLQYEYVDLDQNIEQKTGKSIPEIFSEKGESFFREIESDALKAIEPNHKFVVATGGGAPCFFDNMDFIKNNGISIFLDVPVDELVSRINSHGVDDRPLLAKMKELKKELSEKLEWRLAYYSQADLTVQGVTDSLEVYKQIKHLLV